jgi:quercetin dioxygenase-like cupin family protein
MTMKIDLTQANIRLEPRRELSLADADGVEITCLSGAVWMTMEGDPRDIVLTAGDSHTVRRNGVTLVNALESSLLHVRMPRTQPPAWKRWLQAAWRWLAGAAEGRARAVLSRGLNY